MAINNENVLWNSVIQILEAIGNMLIIPERIGRGIRSAIDVINKISGD